MNLAEGLERYSIYYDGKFIEERIMVGRTEMSSVSGSDRWERVEKALSPDAETFVALRHAVLDPARSVPFVKSVSDDVRRLDTESIRGHRRPTYIATVDLARIGAPSSRTVTIEFWTDDGGTTHRMRHTVLAAKREDQGSTPAWASAKAGRSGNSGRERAAARGAPPETP